VIADARSSDKHIHVYARQIRLGHRPSVYEFRIVVPAHESWWILQESLMRRFRGEQSALNVAVIFSATTPALIVECQSDDSLATNAYRILSAIRGCTD